MSISAHRAGMSALWHDLDALADPSIRPAEVHQSFEGMPMPQEEHRSPKGDLAFQKMEEIYDSAHAQMDAGLKAQAFLYGSNAKAQGVNALVDTDDPTKIAHDEQTRALITPNQVNATRDSEAVRYQMRAEKNDENRRASAQSIPRSCSGGDALSKAKKAEQLVKMAEGLGVSMIAMIGTQAIDGGMSAMIAESASVVKAISTANVAVGLTKPMSALDEEQSINKSKPRSVEFYDEDRGKI